MALSKDVVIRLLGDASSAQAAIKAAADAAEVSVAQYKKAEREQAKQAAAMETAARKQREAMADAGRGAVLFGAVVAAGLGLSVKAAIDWETAWAGVTKVTSGTPAQMDALEASLRQLATTLPATHEEIAGVAEAAGQLGIKRQDIVEFTKVAIALGVSTNLSAEDAANGLARLSNIMGTSSKDVDRLGSTLVGLGNAGASTESEILAMGLRIAAAGHQAGMSEGDVLGLANALSSMGVEAEAGGTAISTVIKKINNSVMDGGKELQTYAHLAGMTAQEFAKAWRDDAAGALQKVVAGLGDMQKSGQNVNTVLSDLGLSDIRVSDAILRLSANAQLLGDSLATGNKAWSDNNALMNEANKRYETTAARLQMARNQITDAAIDIGGTLLPVLATGASLIADFARGFQDLPGPVKVIIEVMGGLAAVIGLVGGTMLIAAPKIVAFKAAIEALEGGGSRAGKAMGGFASFMTGPWGIAIGIAGTVIGGLITWLGSLSKGSEEAASYQKDLASALKSSNGAINDQVRALAAQKAQESGLLDLAPKIGVSGARITDALLGNRDAYNEVSGALQHYVGRHSEVAVQTDAMSGITSSALDSEGQAALDAAGQLFDLSGAMGGAVVANQQVAEATAASTDAQTQQTNALDGSTGAAEQQATTMDGLSGILIQTGASATDVKTAAELLATALNNMNGPTLNARDAARGYQEALAAASAAVTENGRTLDISTEKGRKNQAALDGIAKAAMDQANAIAANGGSYEQFSNSLTTARADLVKAAESMGMSEEAAKALADQVLQIPDRADVQITLPSYATVTQQLTDVQNKIKDIPPQTWTNVGVISQAAQDALNAIGIKTRTLPDGTVEVYADTSGATATLAALTGRRYAVTVGVNISGGILSGLGGHATGGRMGPGEVSWVGERGPELYRAGPAGGYVTPADLSRAAAGMAVGPGVPVGSDGAAAPTTLSIDYDRLAAAVSSRQSMVNVGTWNTYDGQTPHENAEALAWLARTRG